MMRKSARRAARRARKYLLRGSEEKSSVRDARYFMIKRCRDMRAPAHRVAMSRALLFLMLPRDCLIFDVSCVDYAEPCSFVMPD